MFTSHHGDMMVVVPTQHPTAWLLKITEGTENAKNVVTGGLPCLATAERQLFHAFFGVFRVPQFSSSGCH